MSLLPIKLVHCTLYLLTCIEITAFGKFLSPSVELICRVVAMVTVKLDTGGDVHHQARQGGDLVHYVFVVLQHEGNVSFGKKY